MLHLGKDLEYFSKEQFNKLSGLSLEIAKILSGLIKVL
jgi:hypothetical protein